MDFQTYPDIFSTLSKDLKPKPRKLNELGEMLELAYRLMEHPLFSSFGYHEAIKDPFYEVVHPLPIFVLACATNGCVTDFYWHRATLIYIPRKNPSLSGFCTSFSKPPIRWYSHGMNLAHSVLTASGTEVIAKDVAITLGSTRLWAPLRFAFEIQTSFLKVGCGTYLLV